MIEQISTNFFKVMEYYQQILYTILHKKQVKQDNIIDPFQLTKDLLPIFTNLFSDPEKVLKHQLEYIELYSALLNNITNRFAGETEDTLYNSNHKDNRFKDIAWDENVYFNFIKQSYLMTSTWLINIINEQTENLDNQQAKKIQFYSKQIIYALSPSNFAFTNPIVLKETISSKGANLVKGMENFLHDLERSKYFIDIQTSDSNAFQIGLNLAFTKGKIIFQNDLMQLIHYTPLKDKNYSIPLLIIPPCINKYYIFDLNEKNSYIKWLLTQGYNVFLISWINPDQTLADKNFEDYMLEGPIAALDVIEQVTQKKEINVIGYCIGGTLLACTLAYLKAKKDKRIKAATFLTTLLDFSEVGDLAIFIDDKQLDKIEEISTKEGFFDGTTMSTAFSLLRANDMIWSFFINNYLLGKDPLPFDLLYWNSDSTRLPAAMHSFFLRNMYQNNLLIKPGAISLAGIKIDLTTIDIPCYFLSTREDHLAPWHSSYIATQLLACPITFTLSASGHVAGVINHPQNNKYCYWKNSNYQLTPQEWLEGAEEHAGSWWIDWHKWNSKLSGNLISPKKIKNNKFPPIEDAPGSFVKMK